MKLIVFEYFSAGDCDNLLSEGFNMLKSILDDLDNDSFFDIDYLINPNLKVLEYDFCKPIFLNKNLFDWLDENCDKYDCCFFIAPEDDLIQYKITKLLEEHDVKIIGSNSYASYLCSSKILTYENTPDTILKIKTNIEDIDELNYQNISEIYPKSFIIKPDNKTSSEFVFHIHNNKEFNKAIKEYKENKIKKCLIQEYIDGTPVSVSSIVNNEYIDCLSLNLQEISSNDNQITYKGCITPINHKLKNILYKTTKKIIKSIPGLKGFIGIDYIISEDKIYFVEINSRLTTPYIVLQKLCDENLTKTIIDLVLYDKEKKLTFKNQGSFYKGDM